MISYVWLFPILFIFHDMEEIIGFIPWYKKNRQFLEQNYPKISNTYKDVSTEGFAFAVFEEFLFCIIICIISLLTNQYGIWLGGLIGCTLHFIVHMIQTLIIKKYIPAFITSIIGIPVGLFIIDKSIKILNYSLYAILTYSIIGIICIICNLKFAHILMKKFSTL